MCHSRTRELEVPAGQGLSYGGWTTGLRYGAPLAPNGPGHLNNAARCLTLVSRCILFHKHTAALFKLEKPLCTVCSYITNSPLARVLFHTNKLCIVVSPWHNKLLSAMHETQCRWSGFCWSLFWCTLSATRLKCEQCQASRLDCDENFKPQIICLDDHSGCQKKIQC